jgi:ABC-type phosphate transport system ATPase subunit
MSFPTEVLHLDLKKVERPVGESILNISNLNVSHHEHHILKNINLNIPKGKITAFLGIA